MIKRPLGIVAVLYACGLLIGEYFPLPLTVSLRFLAVLPPDFLAPRLRLHLVRLFFSSSAGQISRGTPPSLPDDLRVVLGNEPQLATVRGTLAETPTQRVYLTDDGESLRTTAKLNSPRFLRRHRTWQPASGKISVITPGELPENFCDGQQVQIYGVIDPPPLPIAEGLFDYRAYLQRQEIYFELKTNPPTIGKASA